jgi:hypothetical protein
MKPTPVRTQTSRVRIPAIIVSIASIVCAKPVPDNLGNGLNKIVENKLLQAGQINIPAQNLTSAGQTSGSRTALL